MSNDNGRTNIQRMEFERFQNLLDEFLKIRMIWSQYPVNSNHTVWPLTFILGTDIAAKNCKRMLPKSSDGISNQKFALHNLLRVSQHVTGENTSC